MASSASNHSTSRLHHERPAFIYGTAWKKDHTKSLVRQALMAGFRRVDTAAQPRHYQEHLVGEALREAYSEGIAKRDDLYIQTKYTSPAGQDPNNMPYNPSASLDSQIQNSVVSSLANLRSEYEPEEEVYIDCLLLHSPLPTIEQTLEAWALLETFVPRQIRTLGISNVTVPVLQAILEYSKVKPSVVQNRFYPQTRYDVPLRAFCRAHQITYQSFWTLTGNPALLKSRPVAMLAQAIGVNAPVALYSLVLNLGIEVLNGTTSAVHMREDLEGVAKVQHWATLNPHEWAGMSSMFQECIGDTR